MEQKPNEIIIQTSEIWKNKMAKIGLEVQISGEKINTAFSIIQQQEFWNDDRIRGEASQLWKKKMLPQLFKWTPLQKKMINLNLDENKVLQESAEFIRGKIVNDNSYVVQAEMVKQLGAIGKSSDISLIKKLSKEWSPRHIIRKASNKAILLLEGE